MPKAPAHTETLPTAPDPLARVAVEADASLFEAGIDACCSGEVFHDVRSGSDDRQWAAGWLYAEQEDFPRA